jgi:hypothetical protein
MVRTTLEKTIQKSTTRARRSVHHTNEIVEVKEGL